MTRLLYLVIFLFCFSFFFPRPVSAKEFQASVQVSPLILEYNLLPGETKKNMLVFFNPSKTSQKIIPQIFDFAAADEMGGLRFFENPGWQFSASRWILFNQEPFELAPETEKILPFNILIPEEAQPGSHFAALFGEARPLEEKEIDEEVEVKIHVGAGTLFLINVPDLVHQADSYRGHLVSFEVRGLALIGNWLTKMVKKPIGLVKNKPLDFVARFKNTGNFYQRPKGKIEIFDFRGEKVAEVDLKEQRVLPQATIQFKTDWQPSFLFGLYQARLKFFYGRKNELLTEKDLSFFAFSVFPLALASLTALIIPPILFYLRKKILF